MPAVLSLPRWSTPLKLTVIGASVSFALFGALAYYFRRRKKKPKYIRPPHSRSGSTSRDMNNVRTAGGQPTRRSVNHFIGGRSANNNTQQKAVPNGRAGPSQPTSQTNGDVVPRQTSSSTSAKAPLSRSMSQASLKSDAASTMTLTEEQTAAIEETAETLCDKGLEYLLGAIKHWEDAIEKIDNMDTVNADMEALQYQLHHLIGRAYYMRDHYEERLFRQMSSTAAMDAVIQELDRDFEVRRHSDKDATTGNAASIATESSDQDSFVSALDMADLSDLDSQRGCHQELVLYEAALLELKHGNVPCRSLRTQLLDVASDTEFVAKLHCVRLAIMELFKDETTSEWFAQTGRQLISEIIQNAERDPEEFQIAFDELMDFVRDPSNREGMEQELRSRGVKVVTFYDVVVDFILFDAFDDLDSPPSSLTAVTQNRWLSNGFKETALATAVWSVLKAKRRMLKNPRGFVGHFYSVSEVVSPVLAWGFLGPDSEIKQLCYFFKDQVVGFMQDIFSFEAVRFTTVEELADDIMRLAREYAEVATARMTAKAAT